MRKTKIVIAILMAGALVIPSYVYPVKCSAANITTNAVSQGGFNISSEGVLTSYTSNGEDVVIPDTVTSIGEKAFENCTTLKSITLPSSVKNIGEASFWGCSNLKSITIGEGLEEIGTWAFYGCNLTNITIPEGTTKIAAYAFAQNNNLTSISLPTTLRELGAAVFSNTKLESIEIPNSVTSMGAAAFDQCYALKEVRLSENINTIYARTFRNCTSLERIEIPASVTEMEETAFIENTFTVSQRNLKIKIIGEAKSYAETFAKNMGYEFIQSNTTEVKKNAVEENKILQTENLEIVNALKNEKSTTSAENKIYKSSNPYIQFDTAKKSESVTQIKNKLTFKFKKNYKNAQYQIVKNGKNYKEANWKKIKNGKVVIHRNMKNNRVYVKYTTARGKIKIIKTTAFTIQ